MTHDGPPTRPPHLRPVNDEPPFDPAYDGAPHTRPAPQDDAAERACLGAMLISPAAIDDVAALITPADHYRPAHEAIHRAIADMHLAGQPVDQITVAHHLARQRGERPGQTQLDSIGGAPYLHDLAAGVPIVANVTYYAGIVLEKAKLRTLVNAGTRLTSLGYAGDLEKADIYLGDAVEHINDIATRFGTDRPTSAGLKDLSWLLGGTPPVIPPPTYVRRDDGTALFYAGKVNGVFGDPEGGKTWLAQLAIVEALNHGERAAMIDVDHNGPDHTAARLILLGARMEHLADPNQFRYYEPEDGEELTTAVHELCTWAPNVLVIDSLGEIFPMLGVNTNDTDEMTSAMRLVCSRPAIAGACVITVDHLPKSADARSTGYAIGSIAKKRMIRGSYLRVEARTKPMPGGIGKISLRIEKDTSGELRRSSHGGYAGTLVLDSTQAAVTTWSISRESVPKNADGSPRPTTYMERIAEFVADNAECTGRDIEAAIPGTSKYVRSALNQLIAEGHIVRTPGPKRSWMHTLAIPYREAEDDLAQQTL